MKYLLVIILIIISACSNPDNAETNNFSSNILKDTEAQSSDENSQKNSSNKFCILAGGEKVEEGWSGKDSGNNYCNQCKCMKGNLACTKMACIQKDSIESGEKETSPTLEKPVLDLLTAVDQGNTRIVKQHINFGTNPNYVFIPPLLPFEGASALHLAVLKSNQEIINILIQNGTDINIKAKDAYGGSPLEWACFWGIEEMVKLLIEEGANINSKNNFGGTPLDAVIADNPYVSKENKNFSKNRDLIKEFLTQNNGEYGSK
tara:strand:- start:143 stop:925 length:783 start_codon:yes stop_codon:yes gene_type:complete